LSLDETFLRNRGPIFIKGQSPDLGFPRERERERETGLAQPISVAADKDTREQSRSANSLSLCFGVGLNFISAPNPRVIKPDITLHLDRSSPRRAWFDSIHRVVGLRAQSTIVVSRWLAGDVPRLAISSAVAT
jgi:hypothetical protein